MSNVTKTVAEVTDRLMTVHDTCQILSMGRTKVWKLVKEGKLQSMSFGTRCTRITLSSIQSLITG